MLQESNSVDPTPPSSPEELTELTSVPNNVAAVSGTITVGLQELDGLTDLLPATSSSSSPAAVVGYSVEDFGGASSNLNSPSAAATSLNLNCLAGFCASGGGDSNSLTPASSSAHSPPESSSASSSSSGFQFNPSEVSQLLSDFEDKNNWMENLYY